MLRAVFYCEDENESFVIIFERCDRCVSFCDHLESLYFCDFTYLDLFQIRVDGFIDVGDGCFHRCCHHNKVTNIFLSPSL